MGCLLGVQREDCTTLSGPPHEWKLPLLHIGQGEKVYLDPTGDRNLDLFCNSRGQNLKEEAPQGPDES